MRKVNRPGGAKYRATAGRSLLMDADIYVFSRAKREIWLHKCIYIVSLVVWLGFLAWEGLWRFSTDSWELKISYPLVSLQIIAPVLLFTCLLHYLAMFKFAYRIVFDLQKGRLRLFMYRRPRPLAFQIRDLNLVRIDWHTCFILRNGRIIWYKSDPQLLSFLRDKNIPREWGKTAKLLLKEEFLKDEANFPSNAEQRRMK